MIYDVIVVGAGPAGSIHSLDLDPVAGDVSQIYRSDWSARQLNDLTGYPRSV